MSGPAKCTVCGKVEHWPMVRCRLCGTAFPTVPKGVWRSA